MKLWIKITIGVIIGLFFGAILPEKGGDTASFFSGLSEFFIHAGRYGLYGLVFFGLAVGTYELRKNKDFTKTYLFTTGLTLLTTFVLVFIGVLIIVILSPQRIFVFAQEETVKEIPKISELLLSVFPKNIFAVFAQEGNFLLPIFFLAVILGLSFNFDEFTTAPVANLFDSLSRIFFHIYSYIVQIMAIAVVSFTISFTFEIRSIVDASLFYELILIISLLTVFFIFIVFPLLIYFLCGRENPYKWLFGILPVLLTAFFSGDGYLSMGMLMFTGKKNHGIPRKMGSSIYTFLAVFGKAGTAMVVGVSFIIILKSYSSLGISFSQFVWVIFMSFSVSFILGSVPGIGVLAGLSLLSSIYGKGVEDWFLILNPIMPILISFGVLLDIVANGFIAYLISHKLKMRSEVETYDFV
jgi:aerobic C4-dicarboxylate transport protein